LHYHYLDFWSCCKDKIIVVSPLKYFTTINIIIKRGQQECLIS
ncbi:MAG: hypothetical protein ACI80H_001922, partial [Pseudoalteromonas distincta]